MHASNDCQTMKLLNQSELNLPSILLTLILQITAKKINNKKKHKNNNNKHNLKKMIDICNFTLIIIFHHRHQLKTLRKVSLNNYG
jgi:hypothetical protein